MSKKIVAGLEIHGIEKLLHEPGRVVIHKLGEQHIAHLSISDARRLRQLIRGAIQVDTTINGNSAA